MADVEKRNSSVDSKKKSSSFGDDDFGKDFLSFWEPSKKGKDEIDFDVEGVPQNKKKSFNFDKFDDFDLGGNFDKLPSFKMDMPDLDFNSPVIKTDKPTEKHKGKQESKQEKFTFNFDFAELDRFDLDCSPVTGEKNPSKVANGNASDDSFKHACDHDFKSNSGTSTDAFKDQKSTKPLNTSRMSTSKPDNLVQSCTSEGSRLSISQDLGHNDVSHNVSISTIKQIAEGEEKHEIRSNESHKDQPQGITDPNAEKSLEDSIQRSASGDCFARQDLPEFRIRPSTLNVVKNDPSREGDSSMRTVESSQSRNSSPVNSYKTRCSPETNLSEPPNGRGDFQKHCQWNEDEVSRGMEFQSESIQANQNSESKLIPSPVQRDSRSCKSMSLNEKVTASLQLKALNRMAGNVSRRNSPENKKQLDFMHNNKLKTMDICQVNDNSSRLKTSNLKQQNISCNTATSAIPKLVSGTASVRCSKASPVESNGTSFKKNRICNTGLTMSSITNLNIKLPSSAAPKEAKSVGFPESKVEFPLNTTSRMENSVVTEESGSLNLLLKRKTFEEPAADPETLKPLKFSSEIAIERKSFGFSANVENPVELRSFTDIEVPVLIEQDGKTEKAEACGKEHEEVGKTMTMKERIVALQNKPISKSASHVSVAATQNEDDSLHNCKLKALNIIPVNDNSEAKQKNEQAETQKLGILKLYDKGSTKGISINSRCKKNDTCNEPSGFQKTASLQQQTTANNTPKSIIANLVSSIASKKSSKIVPVEIKGSTKYDKTFDGRLTLPRTQNSATAKETKLVGIYEGCSDFQLRTSKMADPVHTEKTASINNSLKRKTFEDSLVHLESSNPLKCIKESAIGRKPFEFSPKVERAVVNI